MRIEDFLLEKAGKMAHKNGLTLMAARLSLTEAVLKSQAKRLKLEALLPKKNKDRGSRLPKLLTPLH